MEELDRNIHQFQQGTELWEIGPQVTLIYPVCDYLPPSHMQENNPLQHRALMWKERKAQSHSWMVRAEPISAIFFSLPSTSYLRPRQLNLHWCLWSFTWKVLQPESFLSLMNRNKMLKYFCEKVSFLFLQRKRRDIAWELEYCISAKFQTSTDINQKVRLEEKKHPTKRQNKTHRRPWESHWRCLGMSVAGLRAHDKRERQSNHFMVIINNTEYVFFNYYFHFNKHFVTSSHPSLSLCFAAHIPAPLH